MLTRDNVVARACALFGTRADEALAWSDRYGTAPHEPEVHRVHIAILEAADGRLSRLPYFVACAKIDYRDVLTGARLPAMSDAEEAEWQARADRQLAEWERTEGMQRTHMSPDEAQVRALVHTWHAATRTGDVDTVLSLMTDDVTFLVAGRPPMDKAAFAALMRVPDGAPRPAIETSAELLDVQVSGDTAWLVSALTVTVTPAGGQPMVRAGHTLTVLRRVDGRWLVARDANLLTPVSRGQSR